MGEIDKVTVYQNLREEMMDFVKRQDSYLLASVTITITALSFSVEKNNEWFALFAMMILVPLSLRVIDFRHGTVFLSSFMAVFLEEEKYTGWEYVHDEYYKVMKNHKSKNPPKEKLFKGRSKLLSFASKSTYCFLSSSCVIVFWFIRCNNMGQFKNVLVETVLAIIQAAILLLQVILARKYYDTNEKKNILIEEWEIVKADITEKEKKSTKP